MEPVSVIGSESFVWGWGGVRLLKNECLILLTIPGNGCIYCMCTSLCPVSIYTACVHVGGVAINIMEPCFQLTER